MSSTYASVDHLAIELDGDGTLRMRIAKPDKRNALDDDMVATMIDAFDAAGRDEAVRVVVISSEGDHFCSGFDIVGRNTGDGSGQRPRVGSIQRRLPSQAHRLIALVASVQVPIVCGVRGVAAGIGLHLAAAADFTVVADDARLWEPFTQRGFTPDSGGTWLLPRLVGMTRARELLMLGRELSGTEAAAWGLVHVAVPSGQVDTAVDEIAGKLRDGPTVALGLTKWLLHVGATAPLERQLRDEAFAMELSSRSEDFREGLAAFMEKRSPRFGGR